MNYIRGHVHYTGARPSLIATPLYSELGRIRAQNIEKSNEVEVRLTTLAGHKNKLEKELEKSRDSLKSE